MNTKDNEGYVTVLTEIINNRYTPLTPSHMKEIFGVDKSSQSPTEYDRVRTNLQRILDFYTSAKIITIVTDTIQNEIKRLENQKDMKKLKPYIELLKQKYTESNNKRNKEIESKGNNEEEVLELTLKKICDMYQRVEKTKTINTFYVDKRGKKIEESLIPIKTNEIETDEKGYFLVEIDDIKTKVKLKKEEKTSYQLLDGKFNYINVNYFEEMVEYETFHFTNENKKIIRETICLEDEVDLDNTEISPYDIMYRLYLDCDFRNKYGKLESPIEFQIPQKDIETFVEFFVSSISDYNYDIQSKSIVKLSKSDMFQNKSLEVQQFITNTFSKVIIKLSSYLKGKETYSLQLLIDLIETKSKLNLKFVIDEEEVIFSKTLIKKLTFKENEIDIKLSHSTITLTNINQISEIQSYDTPLNLSEIDNSEIEKKFWEDVGKLENILNEDSNDYCREITETISNMKNLSTILFK